jgi:hypothetical protein
MARRSLMSFSFSVSLNREMTDRCDFWGKASVEVGFVSAGLGLLARDREGGWGAACSGRRENSHEGSLLRELYQRLRAAVKLVIVVSASPRVRECSEDEFLGLGLRKRPTVLWRHA